MHWLPPPSSSGGSSVKNVPIRACTNLRSSLLLATIAVLAYRLSCMTKKIKMAKPPPSSSTLSLRALKSKNVAIIVVLRKKRSTRPQSVPSHRSHRDETGCAM